MTYTNTYKLSQYAAADKPTRAEHNSDNTKLEAALAGKAASSHTHSNYVPTSRTVNGKALSGNITLSAADVGAYTKAQVDSANFFVKLADVSLTAAATTLSITNIASINPAKYLELWLYLVPNFNDGVYIRVNKISSQSYTRDGSTTNYIGYVRLLTKADQFMGVFLPHANHLTFYSRYFSHDPDDSKVWPITHYGVAPAEVNNSTWSSIDIVKLTGSFPVGMRAVLYGIKL